MSLKFILNFTDHYKLTRVLLLCILFSLCRCDNKECRCDDKKCRRDNTEFNVLKDNYTVCENHKNGTKLFCAKFSDSSAKMVKIPMNPRRPLRMLVDTHEKDGFCVILNDVLSYREPNDQYKLGLQFFNSSGEFVGDKNVILILIQVNRYPPRFDAYNDTLNLEEEVDNGQKVLLTLKTTDEDFRDSVNYSIKNLESFKGAFELKDANTAQLSNPIKLDFETKEYYRIEVIAMDNVRNRIQGGHHTSTAVIHVNVIDIDDQPPIFRKECGMKRVKEHSKGDVFNIQAIDGDRGINHPIGYSLEGVGQEFFYVNRDVSGVATIVVNKEIDREDPRFITNPLIEFVVQADEYYDAELNNMTFNRTASSICSVIIEDINDNRPIFSKPEYNASVIENTQFGIPVTFDGEFPNVKDIDEGENARFDLILENNNGTFTVTPTEGINNVTFLLRVNNSTALDYERSDLDTPKHLQLRIVAKEKSKDISEASTADIKVYLEDENDNFPQFISQQQAAVSENASAGDFVSTIQATDEDSGLFGTEGIRYSLMPSHISNSFSLDWITGNLSVGIDKHGFDRETTETLYLTVEARDNNGTGNRNTTQLLIELLDANDNAPIFLFNTYRAQLMENSLNFMNALIVEAKDRDKEGTNNSEVRYAITDGDKWGQFQIDNVNGTVTPVKELDFEDNNGPPIDEHCISVCTRTYELSVTAYDLGVPQQSSNVSVYIVLQDENDNAPEFLHSDLTATINETSTKGTIVTQVNATDADISPIYKNISYSIIQGGEGNFVTDRNNGLVTVAGNADLDVSGNEAKKQRQFVVDASDAMMKSSSCKITVNIVDINDKDPQFRKPETTEYELMENVKNISIGMFPAFDPDETACLNYSIDYDKSIALQPNLFSRISESYDYTSIFEITNEGELLVPNHADREEMKQITLHLKVVDLNAEVNIPQEDRLTIRITILDENDNDPTFVNNHTSSGYEGSVPENVKGVSLFSILAIDIDENNTITYSIEGDKKANKHFDLNSETGELRVIWEIDYEEYEFFNFTAVATDNGVPKRNASAEVLIKIIDENDNSPQFENESYNKEIEEHVPEGTFVIQINASDKDSGDYGLVHFRILKLDADDDYFAINTTTGVITVDGDLDREVQEVFKINVQAYDNPKGYAASQRTNNTKVTVVLLDINDHAPEIDAIDGCLSISEITAVNISIAKLIAKDKDKENTLNSEVEFFIEKGDYFGISLNGTLYVKSSLRNLHENFTVVVMAKDKGQPPLNSTRSFCVEVYDVNTHKPEFVFPPPGNNTTVIVVDENDNIGKEVYKFKAKDDDKNKKTNGNVSYTLLSEENQDNNQDFIVSPTGSLLVNAKLNKAIKSKYKIEVKACDNGVPVQCADHAATLHIYIKSETDTKPHFDKQNAIVSFTEHSKPGDETQHIPKAELKEMYVQNISIPICYYIVEGDADFFELDHNSGTLKLAKEVDREETLSLSIIVQAEAGCPDSLPKLNKAQSISQPNILTVDVKIIDINDNAPIFSKKEFSGGVDTKDKAGKHILTIHATDADEGKNAVVTYLIVGEIKVNKGEGLDKVSVYFTLNETTGAIFLAFQPAADTKGHFTFTVMAKDIDDLSDTAQVSIYIMRSDQQIRLIVAKDVNEVTEDDISHLQAVLERATTYIVNVGDVASYSGNDKRYTGFTQVLIHLVDPDTNEVLESDKAISIIDQTYKDILGMLNPSVRLIGAPKYVEEELEQSFWKKHGYHILFGIIGLLSFAIFLILIVYFIRTSSYKRRVKAATAKAFGPDDSALNDFSKTTVPNTNLHAVQGSNPIWNQEDEMIKKFCEKDNLSESGSANSLDVNVIEPEYNVENNYNDNPLFSNEDETNSFENRNDFVELVSESPAVLRGTEYTRQQSTDLGSRLNTLRTIDSDWRKRLSGNITPIISEQNFTFGSDRISESNEV